MPDGGILIKFQRRKGSIIPKDNRLRHFTGILRGGGGLGQASCLGGATLEIAVTPPLRIKPGSAWFRIFSDSISGGKFT
ncbi:hypothetical protein PUN28_002919 [Cardiocondyla obscurior]|uniref:Uncharacterized protein n=1 Tax=Cardiocondyla obscurior TaxID=286306 RepID=A0AAW2GX16_9HYME